MICVGYFVSHLNVNSNFHLFVGRYQFRSIKHTDSQDSQFGDYWQYWRVRADQDHRIGNILPFVNIVYHRYLRFFDDGNGNYTIQFYENSQF